MIFAKYIKFFLRFSRPILLLVAAGTVLFFLLATKIRFRFSLESLFDSGAPELERYQEFSESYGSDDGLVMIAFKAPDVFQDAELRMVRSVSDEIRAIRIDGRRAVRRVLSIRTAVEALREMSRERKLEALWDPALVRRDLTSSPLTRNFLVSGDGRTASILIELEPEVFRNEERAREFVRQVQERLRRESADWGIEFHLAGVPVIEKEYVRLIRRDLLTFLPIAVGSFVILLAVYFRNITGTLLPVVIVVAAVLWTLGWMQLFGVTIGLLTSVFPTLVLVTGISDAVHILSNYQENLPKCPDKRDALARTLLHLGMACFMTTATSALGFASLAITDVAVVREFGLITALGIILSYAATLAIMPAVLDNVPPPRGVIAEEYLTQVTRRSLGGFAGLVIRFPGLILVGAALLMGVAVWGITKIQIRSSWLQDLKENHPVHRSHVFVQENLSSVFSADFELASEKGFQDPETLRAVQRLEEFIRERRGDRVRYVASLPLLIREVNAQRRRLWKVAAALPFGPANARQVLWKFDVDAHRSLPEGKDLRATIALLRSIEALRPFVRRTVHPSWKRTRLSVHMAMTSVELESFVEDVQAYHRRYLKKYFDLVPTGKSWMAKRALDRVMRDMGASVFLVAGAFFLAFSILFGSLKAGLLTVIPNVVPLVVTAGLMGWAGVDLNFSTVTVFTISLGLAVDNTIHFLSRFRVEMVEDQDPVEATRRTILGAGRPMIFTSILLTVGFAAILTSSFRLTFYFGLLGGVTILAALFADLFILPALMLVFRPRVARWEAVQKRLEQLDEVLARVVRFDRAGDKSP